MLGVRLDQNTETRLERLCQNTGHTKRLDHAAITLSIKSWKPLFDSLNKFTDDFLETRDQPKQQTREDIFL